MTLRAKLVLIGLAVLALAGGGVGMAVATDEDDSDELVTGVGADRARAAALEITDGGTANAVELDSENGATWEVEVTEPDGNQVDVRLDESYDLVIVEDDNEDPDATD